MRLSTLSTDWNRPLASYRFKKPSESRGPSGQKPAHTSKATRIVRAGAWSCRCWSSRPFALSGAGAPISRWCRVLHGPLDVLRRGLVIRLGASGVSARYRLAVLSRAREGSTERAPPDICALPLRSLEPRSGWAADPFRCRGRNVPVLDDQYRKILSGVRLPRCRYGAGSG